VCAIRNKLEMYLSDYDGTICSDWSSWVGMWNSWDCGDLRIVCYILLFLGKNAKDTIVWSCGIVYTVVILCKY